MDYVYSPATETNVSKEPEIAFPPVKAISGYVKASSSLAELELMDEEQEIDEEPLKYEPLPQVLTASVDANLANQFPKETNERLSQLSNKANERKVGAPRKGGFLVNLATTYTEILDELLFVNNLEDFISIFKKEGRMVAVGIFLIILATVLMLL